MGFFTGRLAAAVAIAALYFTAGSARGADKKLVPFPEDESRDAQPSEPSKTRLPLPKKSTFEPRFKTPSVRQAQHQEPVSGDDSESSGPSLNAPEQSQPAEGACSRFPRRQIRMMRQARRWSTKLLKKAKSQRKPTI